MRSDSSRTAFRDGDVDEDEIWNNEQMKMRYEKFESVRPATKRFHRLTVIALMARLTMPTAPLALPSSL